MLEEENKIEEALRHAIAAGAEKVTTDALNALKKFFNTTKELTPEQIKELNYDEKYALSKKYLNLAFKYKNMGDNEKYSEYIGKAVELTRYLMSYTIPSIKLKENKNIKGEGKMIITEGQLKQIINEEIQSMIEEGDIDEGLLDLFKAGAQKVGGDIAAKGKEAAAATKTAVAGQVQKASDAVTKVKDAAVKYKDELVRVSQTASTKADIINLIDGADKQMTGLVTQMQTLQAKARQLKIPVDLTNVVKGLQVAVTNMTQVKQSLSAAQPAVTEEE